MKLNVFKLTKVTFSNVVLLREKIAPEIIRLTDELIQ